MTESLGQQYRRVAATIAYYKELYGYKEEELATIAHIGKSTWATRKARPDTYTIGELGLLAKRFNVPLRQMLIGGGEQN